MNLHPQSTRLSAFPRAHILERTFYITSDNVTYELHIPPGRAMMTETGTGMPEIQYVTQRGPFQDGESVKDFFLRPRLIEMRHRRNCCSREEYWNCRAELLDILRPNRSGTRIPQGKLRKILPGGAIRDLIVTVQSGPKFEAQRNSEWDSWSIDETIRFIAHNPVYFDPTQHSQTFTQSGALTFPITFPITFSAFGNIINVDYAGSWIEYPGIVITGPLDLVSIVNNTTDESIGFAYSIPDGRVVTIDLTYGAKTVTLDDGTNLIGNITTDSDFATFHLEPGLNNIQVFSSGANLGTSLVLNWLSRYIGI